MLAAENYLYIILRSHLPLLHLFFVLFIKLIADKVAPQRTHMHANLMGTAGLQIALYQAGQRLENLQSFVIGNCVFAVFLHNRHFFTIIRTAADKRFDSAVCRIRYPENQSIISPFNRMSGKLFARFYVPYHFWPQPKALMYLYRFDGRFPGA